MRDASVGDMPVTMDTVLRNKLRTGLGPRDCIIIALSDSFRRTLVIGKEC